MIVKMVFSLFILTCFTCNNYAQTNNHEVQAVKSPIILQVNNKDYKKIGFELIQGDESSGVKSIILQDSVIYLLDEFHNNIKGISKNSIFLITDFFDSIFFFGVTVVLQVTYSYIAH